MPTIPIRLGLLLLAGAAAAAQTAPVTAGSAADLWTRATPTDPATHRHRATNPVRLLLHDQRLIFLSPRRITASDTKWLVPLTGTLTFLLVSDRKNMQDRIHPDTLLQQRSAIASDAGIAALASVPLLLYWRGWHDADGYARDSSVMAARAVIDSLVASEAIRLATRRNRPGQGDGSGDFLNGGVASSSFPSMHASTAWALASVVANRYPGWLTEVGAYGLATAVSMSRITSREHFPSDVLVGSALGWLVGRYVTHAGESTPFRRTTAANTQQARPKEAGRASEGSSYVPLDSWIYNALDRLAALGLIPSQTSGLRPWTRAECLRQLLEADEKQSIGPAGTGVILAALHRELDVEGATSSVMVESVWIRSGAIAGPVLNDSMHFGQTWNNDLGRPFGRGWNSDAGFTARARSGRFFGEAQAEYQRAPGEAPYSGTVRQSVAQLDGVPVEGSTAQTLTSRFRAMEAYVGISVGDFEISVGKQALWWGPTYDSPLSFGSNAEPTKNLKISTQHPFRLPGFLGHLGEIRGEFVIGKLGGQQYTWRPWFNAQKLSFKLTRDLEVGFTRWSIFWGVGHPITVGSFVRNFTSVSSPDGAAGVGRNDPGDRKGGFDFRYRIPGLRNWLTLYSDSYSDDDPSPLAAPRRAAISPGLYLTHVPGIPQLDFRVEAPSTTLMGTDAGGQFIYFNNQYRSGNTNYGDLLGNSVGRDGRAVEGWVAYHLSARDKIELGYRQLKGSTSFLPGGSTQSDGTIKATVRLADGWYSSLMFQYERFWVPLLGGPQRNLSGWLQLTWEPKWQILF
jgi:membrane-associated phospholipid phosphatase